MYQRPPRLNLLPEVIKNLLVINGLLFLATIVLGSTFGIDLGRILGLYQPIAEQFRPYQVISLMFIHANLGHIFFNMFALWMFGYALENVWGIKRFLVYYLITGFGAAALHMGVTYWELQSLFSELSISQVEQVKAEGLSILENNQNYLDETMARANLLLNTTTVGASGAVFGILLAFGMMFPNQRIYLYFAIPVKAKYFVAAYGAFELYNGIANDPGSNVAHFAHLGGMLFGYLLIKFWQSQGQGRY
jgi:membrane associated rhomboid family serine protease